MTERIRFTRREIMKLFGLGAGASVLLPRLGGNSASAAAQACATPGAAKAGGTLTVGQVQDMTGFDPFVLLFANYPVMHQVFDRLIQMDHQLKVNPWLAESWEAPDDGLSVTFHLRSGVKFHNGRAFEAKDVVANIQRAQNKDTGGNIFPKVQTIKSAEAPDASTVVVTFSKPTPNVFDIFDSISIAAPESFEKVRTNPIGTGPFKFKEWIPGDHVSFVRFDDYWQENLPYLDQINIKPFADGEALTTALDAGQIDAGISLPYKDDKRLEANDKLVIKRGQEGALLYILVINPPDPGQKETPLSKKEVRQAINYAMPRQAIVDQALFGVGKPTVVAFPDTSPAYFEDLAKEYPYDLDKAKQLLTEAGYGDGFDMEILAPTSYPELVSMGQILASDLTKIGIKAKITPLEAAVWTPRLYDGDYQATFTFVGRSHKDPLGLFDNSPYRIDNSPVWPKGDFPEGYAEAITAASTTIDPAARKESFRKLNEIMLDQSVQIPISWKYTLFGWQSDVQEFDWSPDDEIKLLNTWLGTC
jgi:peptide/nickel transport system substrate-binding protein